MNLEKQTPRSVSNKSNFRNFEKFEEQHMASSLQLYQKESPIHVFYYEFGKIFKDSLFMEQLRAAVYL